MIAAVSLGFGSAACQSDVRYGGRSSREWILTLDDSSSVERVRAADALGQILRQRPGAASRTVIDALLRALADSSDDVRSSAAAALTTEGVPPEALVPGVHAALHDSAHAEMREFAARILGTFGSSRGPEAVDALTEALTDPSASVRATAAQSLGRIGPAAAPSAVALGRLAHENDARVRAAAIDALRSIHPSVGLVLPIYMDALADESSEVRAVAAYGIAGLTREAESAAPRLLRTLRDSVPEVRRASASALSDIGVATPEVLSALRTARSDRDPVVRVRVEAALAYLENKLMVPPR